MAANFQLDIFKCIFNEMYKFRSRFHWIFFQGSNQQYSSIGSDDGLAPDRRQAIIWTNDG